MDGWMDGRTESRTERTKTGDLALDVYDEEGRKGTLGTNCLDRKAFLPVRE